MRDSRGERERFPVLGDAGRRMLAQLREHPAAPLFRERSGHRLTGADLESLRAFDARVEAAPIDRPGDGVPTWVDAFVAEALQTVPRLRAMVSPGTPFDALPTTDRAALAADIAGFVPDTAPLDRLLHFRTTGTTGHPISIPSHPLVAARYLAFHRRALRAQGVELTHGAGQVGVVLLGWQRRCFTYVSVTPSMGESGLAKINLHPNDWRRPKDRAAWLDAMAPEVYAGDPISFAELATLPLRSRPKALISVSMNVSPSLRAALESRFACPLLDVYSLNEAGPVAAFDPAAGGHVLLQPELFVEIVDAAGRRRPPGEPGEITLTGGFNFCLPLLRYRTGDHAALADGPRGPMLTGLRGRPAVRFRGGNGAWLNNIDASHALGPLGLARHGLHQYASGAVEARLGTPDRHRHDDVRRVLEPLFAPLPVGVVEVDRAATAGSATYSSDHPGGVL